MKRIVTLILAAGLILGATSAAQAVDFKVSGLWQQVLPRKSSTTRPTERAVYNLLMDSAKLDFVLETQ